MFEHARKLALATYGAPGIDSSCAGQRRDRNMPAAFADRLRAPPIAAPAMKIS